MTASACLWVWLNVVVVVKLVEVVLVVDLFEGWPNLVVIKISCVVVLFQAVHDRLLDVEVFIWIVEGVLEDGVNAAKMLMLFL